MAIFEPGPLIGRIRGRVGGAVFTNSRSAPVIRSFVQPIDPATPAQITRRANLGIIAAIWRDDLTPAQRTAWDDLAAPAHLRNSLGLQFTPTGRQLFTRTAIWQTTIPLSISFIAPANPFPFWPDTAISEAAGPLVRLTAVGSTVGYLPLILRVQWSPPLSNAINTYDGPWALQNARLWAVPSVPVTIVSGADIPRNARYFARITPGGTLNVAGFPQTYQIDVTVV